MRVEEGLFTLPLFFGLLCQAFHGFFLVVVGIVPQLSAKDP